MFNVCPACGEYTGEKTVLPGDGWHAFAVCPACGHAHPFLRLPLFAITGASGTGKTALALANAGPGASCVHLDSDILWRPEFDRPEEDYRTYRSLWLNLCLNIAQSGRPVALYGSVVPGQFEALPTRPYFSRIYYLALVCAPEVLAERLRARPGWRRAGSAEFIEKMQAFNRWFLEYGQVGASATESGTTSCGAAPEDGTVNIDLLDTSFISAAEAAAAVRQWIARCWSSSTDSL